MDVVIALAHLRGDNCILPEPVKGIDLEMGGGHDVVAFPQLIGHTWLISPGKHSEAIGVLNISFLGNKVVGFNVGHVELRMHYCISHVIDNHEVGIRADLLGLTRTSITCTARALRPPHVH